MTHQTPENPPRPQGPLSAEELNRLQALRDDVRRKFNQCKNIGPGGQYAIAGGYFRLDCLLDEADMLHVEVDRLTQQLRAAQEAGAGPADPLEDLVQRFSAALLAKLQAACVKYGYESNGFLADDWQTECLGGLLAHVDKGDPRDVAAYCAFMWHHGWSTTPTPTILEMRSCFAENIRLKGSLSSHQEWLRIAEERTTPTAEPGCPTGCPRCEGLPQCRQEREGEVAAYCSQCGSEVVGYHACQYPLSDDE